MRINNKIIDVSSPCFIIGEIGANFVICENSDKNYQQALKLIDLAVEAKVDAVKFQLYRAKDLYVKDAGYADYIGKDKSIYQIIKELELPFSWLTNLKTYCDKNNIIFLCTPFDIISFKMLEDINVMAYKIDSYSINHTSLIKKIAKTNKPIIISTGASTFKDIGKIIKVIHNAGNSNIAILQCTAKYPAPLNTINLQVITEFKKRYKHSVIGLSDHSREPFIAPMGAVALGAKIIEKHFTTDNSLPGPDHSFAILPNELVDLVKNIRLLETTLGTNNKEILESEKELFDFCRRKLFAVVDIMKGEPFSYSNISCLRPGKSNKGIDASLYDHIVDQIAKVDIKKGTPITEELF